MSVTNTDVTRLGGGGPAELEPCGAANHPDCGLRDVLDRVGDKWSVFVIVELAVGPRRFRELQRAIEGISQRMLTLTVRRLERDGLVLRTVYPTVPAHVDRGASCQSPRVGGAVPQVVFPAKWGLAGVSFDAVRVG